MIEKLVVATSNPAKVERYRRVLSDFAISVVGLRELAIGDKPRETGETAEENAEIKAKYYFGLSGLPVFSEDEALYVDFLPEELQPGVHVRRINGIDEASDEELLRYWEEIVRDVPEDKRFGRWHFAYCLVLAGGQVKTFSRDAKIKFYSPSSKILLPGWPMSSLQGSVRFAKPNSELTDEEKKVADQHLLDELKSGFGNLIKSSYA